MNNSPSSNFSLNPTLDPPTKSIQRAVLAQRKAKSWERYSLSLRILPQSSLQLLIFNFLHQEFPLPHVVREYLSVLCAASYLIFLLSIPAF